MRKSLIRLRVFFLDSPGDSLQWERKSSVEGNSEPRGWRSEPRKESGETERNTSAARNRKDQDDSLLSIEFTNNYLSRRELYRREDLPPGDNQRFVRFHLLSPNFSFLCLGYVCVSYLPPELYSDTRSWKCLFLFPNMTPLSSLSSFPVHCVSKVSTIGTLCISWAFWRLVRLFPFLALFMSGEAWDRAITENEQRITS